MRRILARDEVQVMKSHRRELTLNVPARMDFVNITPQVERAVGESGARTTETRTPSGR
jgi:hypothetical protein